MKIILYFTILALIEASTVKIDLTRVPKDKATVKLAQTRLKQGLKWHDMDDDKPAGWNGTFDNRV